MSRTCRAGHGALGRRAPRTPAASAARRRSGTPVPCTIRRRRSIDFEARAGARRVHHVQEVRPGLDPASAPPQAGPLAAAQSWVEAGARFLHVVDLDGARSGEPKSIEHLRRIVQRHGRPVQYGGGLAR